MSICAVHLQIGCCWIANLSPHHPLKSYPKLYTQVCSKQAKMKPNMPHGVLSTRTWLIDNCTAPAAHSAELSPTLFMTAQLMRTVYSSQLNWDQYHDRYSYIS